MSRVVKAVSVIALTWFTSLALAQTPGPEYLDRAKALLAKDPRQAIALIDAVLALPDLPESVQVNARLMRATALSQLAQQQKLIGRLSLYQGLFHSFEQPEQGLAETLDHYSYLSGSLSYPINRCFGGQLRLVAGAELHYQNELSGTEQTDVGLSAPKDEQDKNISLPSPGWSLGTVCTTNSWEVGTRFLSAISINHTDSAAAVYQRDHTLSVFGRNDRFQFNGNLSLSKVDGTTGSSDELKGIPGVISGQATLWQHNNQRLAAGLNARLQGTKFSDYIDYVYTQASGKVSKVTWTGGLRWPVPFDGSTNEGDGSKRNWWANAAVGWQFQPELIVQTGWQYNYSIEQQYWISLTWQTR